MRGLSNKRRRAAAHAPEGMMPMWWEDIREANVALWDLLREQPDIGRVFCAAYFPGVSNTPIEHAYGRLMPEKRERTQIPRQETHDSRSPF